MSNFKSTLIGVLVGGVITWLLAWYYYRRASEELKEESAELRRLNNLMLRGMENAGWVKLNKDESGNVAGFIIEGQLIFSESDTMSADSTVTRNSEESGAA